MSSASGRALSVPKPRGRAIAGLRAAHAQEMLAGLSDLLEAGCQVERALAVLQRQAAQEPLRRLSEQLHADIVEGASLAGALENAGGTFDAVQVAMVRAAEAGGFLPRTLRHLVEAAQRQADAVSQVRRSLTYPAMLAVTAAASIVFLLAYVVPRFTAIYQSAEEALPWPTQVLLAVSGWLTHYWWACLLGTTAAVLLGNLLLRSEEVRLGWDRLLLRLPLIGPMVRDWEMSRFARTMALLLDGGLMALRALRLTAQVVENRALRAQVGRLAEAVERGESLSSQVRGAYPFTPAMAELISIGEESGKLAGVMERLAEQCHRRATAALAAAVALVEPLVILLLGGVIGFIVTAILLPVLLMSTLVG